MADAQIDTIEEENNSEIAALQESEDGGAQEEEKEEEEEGRQGWGDVTEVAEGERAESRAITKSVASKLPSQHSKARLSRMSASTARGDVDVTSSEEEDDDGSSSVLITEIKDDDTETTHSGVQAGRVTQIRLGRSRKKRLTSGRRAKKTEDEEWDTDLENELHSTHKRDPDDPDDDVDVVGRAAYQRLCERLGVVPVSYFLRHLDDHEIVMRYHGLGPQGTQAIAKVLKENLTLERLNLAGNWIEAEGAMYMCKMLHENDYITELSLAENKLGSAGMVHVAKMLAVNSGLRKLDLSNNGFTDKDTGILVEALELNKFLRELNLSHNHLGSDAGELLGPAIGANDMLDTIDLSWNQIRRRGAVCIGKGLKENIRLKVINLAWNGFGPEGGVAVGEAIGVNETLQEIDISGNRVDAHACLSLAKGLRKNEDLQILRMGNNPISTKGAIDIATGLQDNDNSQLTCLDLSDIPVESDLLRLCETLQQKRDLRLIHGPTLRSGNTPDDIGKPAVDPFRRDPLLALREHVFTHDVRVMDVLGKYDLNHSYSLPPESFTAALEEIAAPISKDQIDDLVIKLDVNNDGNVFYGDIFKQMENSAILAQEKGYIGFVPKTPSLLSRDQSFLNDNLNASVNVPLLKSQVISSEIAETPSTKTSTNNITAVSQTNLESAPTPASGSEKVAKLELTKKEIPLE